MNLDANRCRRSVESADGGGGTADPAVAEAPAPAKASPGEAAAGALKGRARFASLYEELLASRPKQ
jgi:hypothetical protein